MISIIVPVYKAEQCIIRCIDSIISQTYKDWELILVDDGSPDLSGTICDEYAVKNAHIKVFHKENGGVSSARNYGLDKVNGEYICFIDSDDFISKTYLEDFGLKTIDAELFAQGTKVVINNQIIEERGFSDEEKGSRTLIEAFCLLESRNIINSPVFKLYKYSIIRDHQLCFKTETSYGEDHIFSLDYLQYVESIYLSPAKGYMNDRSNDGSLSRRVVPVSQMIYYTKTVCLLQKKLIDNLGWNNNKSIMNVVSSRFYSNWIRTIKSILYSTTVDSYTDYKYAREEYGKYFIFNVGLSTRELINTYIYKYLPAKVSFSIFRVLVHFAK